MIDAALKHSDGDDLSEVSEAPKKKAANQKVPSMDGDGSVKCTRAPNWHKEEEETLIEKYMENCETLTAELKDAGGKGRTVTSEMKDRIWQEIKNSINR